MVVLPAPVGPTSATVWPGSATRSTPCSTGVCGSYAKLTPDSSTRPDVTSSVRASLASRTRGSSSSSSKMRSAPAIADCT